MRQFPRLALDWRHLPIYRMNLFYSQGVNVEYLACHVGRRKGVVTGLLFRIDRCLRASAPDPLLRRLFLFLYSSKMASRTNLEDTDLQAALQEHFGFSEFLQGQEETIRNGLKGRDMVVVMPTGSGKSLCYQLSSLVLPGISIVVSPLIALMKDQVDGLEARGLPATYINSSLSAMEMRNRIEALRSGSYKLVYVAPERFRDRRFLDALGRNQISLMAVDEAHCISQWGHDFRPEYLRLREVLVDLPSTRVMAMTATATPNVRYDIIKQLGLGEDGRGEPLVLVYGFSRPNLKLVVSRVSGHAEKMDHVRKAVERYQTGIIYCATRKQTEKVYGLLKAAGQTSSLYHGGLQDTQREEIQDEFMNGDTPVVVATNAFGMGVDRRDLHFVVHWDVPGSIEAYYQEVGRSGRDGEESLCELLYSYADVRTQEFFLDGANPSREEVETLCSSIRQRCLNGPAVCDLSKWVGPAGISKNEMTVRTGLSILERAGLIRCERVPRGTSLMISMVAGADLGVLEQQFVYLSEKRNRDKRKLQDMLRYAGTQHCRHAYILNYFGESDVAAECANCDRCRRLKGQEVREPTEEEWPVLQKVLSCVARMRTSFGCARVVQVLTGSKAKPVLERGLDRLSTYGLLKDHGEGYVRRILDELVQEGCVRITTGDYPLVDITERGRNVMWRKETVAITWPSVKLQSKTRSESREWVVPSYDAELFQELKSWRSAEAQVKRVPAFVVMHDATLQGVAAFCPQNLSELERVKGIGPTKVAKYGDALLGIIDDWVKKQENAPAPTTRASGPP